MELDLVNVINISVSETPVGLGPFNVNNLALFTSDATPAGWDPGQLYAVYVDAKSVGDDFGTTSETYQQAVAVFSQNPNILGGNGSLIVFPLTGGGSEALVDAIPRTAGLIFYCGIIATAYPASASMKALADVVQAYENKILFLPTADSAVIAGAFTTIKNAADYQTRCLYYSVSALEARLFAAAYAGRALSVNFNGSLTAMTMNLATLSTIDPDPAMTQTLYNSLATAGVDAYVSYAGVPSVVSNGANKFYDEVYNLIWFVCQLQVNGFNVLKQVGTKIPQTEPGMSVLKGAYRQACEQALTVGYVAPGEWTSPNTFGVLQDFLDNVRQRGFYIYSQPVGQQATAAREAREAPLVQIAIKQAGAIHSSDVIVNVNR